MLNSGKKWTPYGTGKLISMSIKGATHREMARALCRTPKAIERKKHSFKRRVVSYIPFGEMMLALRLGYGVLREKE